MRQCRTCGRPSPELICDDCMDEVENPTVWVDATVLDRYTGKPIEYSHPYGTGGLIDMFDVIADSRVPTGVVLCDGVAVKLEFKDLEA